ncbi:MAG: sensor domain-containing diguanylate cyclase [Spirochaetia bacterium]
MIPAQTDNTTQGSRLDDLVKLSFFTEIGKAITSAQTVTETMKAVMDQVGKVFAPTYWSLLLRTSKTGELRFAIVVGSGVESLMGKKLPRGKGIAGWIAENGQSVIVEDVSRDKRFDPDMDNETDFTTKSIIGVPLKSRTKVFGVIELINKLDGSNFTSYELTLLQTIADYAAIAIEKNYYLKALKHVASVDSLTGLYNRRTFSRFFEKEIARAQRQGSTFSLMMIDIDKFKQINDSLGHETGDRVLLIIAGILKEITRTSDMVCRFGGDEFLILLPNSDASDSEALKGRIESELLEHNQQSKITISVSFGMHTTSSKNAKSAIDFVDRQMYKQKNSKRDHPPLNEQDITDISAHTDEIDLDET